MSPLIRRRCLVAPAVRLPRLAPPLALSETERQVLRDVLCGERFADCAPPTIYATLLDEGTYLASVRTMYRLLAVDGFVMFSCLGPDTARELRGIYQALGWPAAGHQLTDMHDWGDMLVQTGFAEPVMDMERITLTYDSPARLLQELRELGRNFHPERFGALRGRRWRTQLEQVLSERLPRGPDGRLQLTFELIYGHALKARPKVKVSALSAVSVQDMRSMLQQPRT